MFVPRYDEQQAREAVQTSLSYTEALRKSAFALPAATTALFRRYVDEIWRIPTDHFDPHRGDRETGKRSLIPLDEVLVEHCEYNRRLLKRRLYKAGLKQPQCELCGQGELWRGRYMSLILDHINGITTDNRIENLRVVSANCNATLDTHCGRNNRQEIAPRACQRCGAPFRPAFPSAVLLLQVLWHASSSKEAIAPGAAQGAAAVVRAANGGSWPRRTSPRSVANTA